MLATIIILVILFIVLFIVLFTGFYLILSAPGKVSNNLYCEIFERKDRRLWRKFIKDYDNFKLLYFDNFGKEFISNCDNYKVIVWGNSSPIEGGLCSVHNAKTDECILSTFDKKMSRILANKLLSKLDSNEGA